MWISPLKERPQQYYSFWGERSHYKQWIGHLLERGRVEEHMAIPIAQWEGKGQRRRLGTHGAKYRAGFLSLTFLFLRFPPPPPPNSAAPPPSPHPDPTPSSPFPGPLAVVPASSPPRRHTSPAAPSPPCPTPSSFTASPSPVNVHLLAASPSSITIPCRAACLLLMSLWSYGRRRLCANPHTTVSKIV